MHRSRILTMAGLLAALALPPALAEEPAATGVPPETDALQRSLDRIATALEALIDHQETDLLLKRLEMRERRIAPLEDELRRRQGDLLTGQAELERLESVKREWRDRMRDAGKTDEEAAKELERMEAELEHALQTQTSQLRALQERVRQLEDDLLERRKLIRDLEALLLERVDD